MAVGGRHRASMVGQDPDPRADGKRVGRQRLGCDDQTVLLPHPPDREARQQAAMSELTPTERTAFVLRHMEDRSTDEIAAALKIAPNAAKQAVFRAVQKLRRQLAPLWVNT